MTSQINGKAHLDTLYAGCKDPIVLSERYDLAGLLLYAGRADEALEQREEGLKLIIDEGRQTRSRRWTWSN